MTKTVSVPFRVEARIQLPRITRENDFGVLSNHDMTHHPRSPDESRQEGRWIKRLKSDLKPTRDQDAAELSLILCFVPTYQHFMEFILGESGDFDYLLKKFQANGHTLTLPGIEFVLKDGLGQLVPDVETFEPIGRCVEFPTDSHLVEIRKIRHRWTLSESEWSFQKEYRQKYHTPSWRTYAVLGYTGTDQNLKEKAS